MTTAIIDLGSNSVRMDIIEINGNEFEFIKRYREYVRLSEGLATNGFLQREPILRTLNAVKTFKEKIDKYHVEKIVAVCTAAMRIAKNPEEIKIPLSKMGIDLVTIDGEKEGYYDYLGVIGTMDINSCVIADVGGASSEFILVQNREAKGIISLPFGAVNITENYFVKNSTKNAFDEILSQIKNIDFLKNVKDLPVVGLGGSVRSLAQYDCMLKQIEAKMHGYEMDRKAVDNISKKVINMSLEEVLEKTNIEKKRADIIKGGLTPINALMYHINSPKLVICQSGLREGILYAITH